MHIVEQAAVIEAPLEIVWQAMNDLESIPRWATVKGTIGRPQGQGMASWFQRIGFPARVTTGNLK